MSSHPHAKLVYGIDLGCEPVFHNQGEEESYDFTERVERESGGGVSLVQYGSYENETYIVGFQVQRTDDWGAEKVKPMKVNPKWDAQIADLVKRLGVKVGKKKPGWHIAAFYG